MKFLKSTKPIQYITFLYGILYLLFVVSGDFSGSYPSLSTEGVGVYILFVVFVIGFLFSWRNAMTTGMIFIFWYIGMLILELFIVEKDGGFGIVSGIPVLILGIFFIKSGYKSKEGTDSNTKK
jgi:hypothetical protein